METKKHDTTPTMFDRVRPFHWGVLGGNYPLPDCGGETEEGTGLEEGAMNHDYFAEFLEDIVHHMRETMLSKNHEYAPGNDKLANFKSGAKALGVTPEQCLWFYTMKHIISIQDIVNGDAGYTPEKLREKAGDLRCYSVLLEALMKERHT